MKEVADMLNIKTMKKSHIMLAAVTIIVLIAMIISIVYSCVFTNVYVSENSLINEYKEFYISVEKKEVGLFLDFGEGSHAPKYRIKMYRSQKAKLLKQIKQEIEDALKTEVAYSNGILNGYQISKDFKKVHIYYNKGKQVPSEHYQYIRDEVREKSIFYHEIADGGQYETEFDAVER